MATYFILSAEETSASQVTAPSQGQIETALDHVNMQGRSYIAQARWFSPTRIDRLNPIAGTTSTRVRRVLEVDDNVADPLTKAREIANNTKQALDHAGDDLLNINYQDWSDVSVVPFTGVEGSLEDWQSGRATISPTSQGFPSQIPQPDTSLVKWVLVAGGVGLATYLLWPVLSGARSDYRARRAGRASRSRYRYES